MPVHVNGTEDNRQFLASGHMQGSNKVLRISTAALLPSGDLTEAEELRLADAYCMLTNDLPQQFPGWRIVIVDRYTQFELTEEDLGEPFLASIAADETLTQDSGFRHLRVA